MSENKINNHHHWATLCVTEQTATFIWNMLQAIQMQSVRDRDAKMASVCQDAIAEIEQPIAFAKARRRKGLK